MKSPMRHFDHSQTARRHRKRSLHALVLATFWILSGCGGKPQAPRDVYDQGKAAMDKGDLATAAKYFQRAVDADPKLADAQFRLGTVLLKQQKGKLAVKPLEAAAELKPKDAKTQFRLCEAYLVRHKKVRKSVV